MSKLLINEHPLQVLPGLAVKFGLNEAIVIQQLHYWTKKSNEFIDGEKWVYNTIEEWSEQFPFWSERTIRRIFNRLCEIGVVEKGKKNKSKGDHTLWYRLSYGQVVHIDMDKVATSGCGQSDRFLDVDNMATSFNTETTTETTTEKKYIKDSEVPKIEPSKPGGYWEFLESYPKIGDWHSVTLRSLYSEAVHDLDGHDVFMISVMAFKKYHEVLETIDQWIPNPEKWLKTKRYKLDWDSQRKKAMEDKGIIDWSVLRGIE